MQLAIFLRQEQRQNLSPLISTSKLSRGIAGAKIWFTGEPDPDNPALLAITDTGMGSGNMLASGVGVEILNDDQDTISINNADSVVYPLKAGRNTLSFIFAIIDPADGHVRNATAVMYFDMQYE